MGSTLHGHVSLVLKTNPMYLIELNLNNWLEMRCGFVFLCNILSKSYGNRDLQRNIDDKKSTKKVSGIINVLFFINSLSMNTRRFLNSIRAR